MTSAPASASRDEQNGAATACSTAITLIPSRAPMMAASVRAGHAEHVLGDEGQHEIGRDRRHLIEPRLAEFALHVVFLGKSKAAMGLDTGIRCFPGRIGREHF